MTAASYFLRSLTAAFLLFALLVPSCRHQTSRTETLILVDVSASVEPSQLQTRLDEIEQLTSQLRGVRTAAFSDHLMEVPSAADLAKVPVVDEHTRARRENEELPEALDRGRSDLESALRGAAASLPHDRVGRVVLVTDGAQNQGDGRQAIPLLRERGIRVSAVPLEVAAGALRVSDLELRPVPRAGGVTAAQGRVWSPAGGSTAVEVQLNGETISRMQLELDPGENVFEFDLPFTRVGEQALTLRLDGRTQYRRLIPVGDPYRVLFVAGIGEISPLPDALQRIGMKVTQVPPRSLQSGSPWRGSDIVVLSGVEAKEVPEAIQRDLASWITSGGALLFAAGERTYGKDEDQPGWTDSPIEEVLPARFRVQEERRDVALMVALDKSYSMKGEKMALAKEATKAALEELDDEHLFGVVAFDWNSFDAVPLQSAGSRAEIRDLISRIEASAQTNFYPALESCLRQLQAAEAKIKHVILISDGKTYPDDYETLIARMRSDRITVSTIAVGAEADRELLEQIAKWGDGQSYFVEDASRVKRVLLQETRKKTDDTLVEQETFVEVAQTDRALNGIDFKQAPPLRGFVSFEPRDGEPILLSTGDDKPLLMSRRIGLGTTWLLATDLGWRWSSRWVAWDGFVPLLSQILRRAADSPFLPDALLSLTARGRQVELLADVRGPSGSFLNGALVEVAVSGAQSGLVRLRQTTPGRYAGTLSWAPDAGSDLRFELRVDGKPRYFTSFFAPTSLEQRSSYTNLELLEEVANATGGAVLDRVADALVPSSDRAKTRLYLRPWFLVLALLLYFTDLFLHRTGWAEKRADLEATAAT